MESVMSFPMIIIIVLLTLATQLSCNSEKPALNVVTRNGRIGHPETGIVSRDIEYVYQFLYTDNTSKADTAAIRVLVSSKNSSSEAPVLFVVRQMKSVLSWQVPLILDSSFMYESVSRTLCPIVTEEARKRMFVEVSTSSFEPVNFSINTVILNGTTSNNASFDILPDRLHTYEVSPAEPEYYRVTFPQGVSTLLVKVTSPDSMCMDVSVQDIECPVYDLDRNVQFTGIYQTMTKKSAIAVQRKEIKSCNAATDLNETCSFFLAFVVKPNDMACTAIQSIIAAASKMSARRKTLDVMVSITTPETIYLKAILVAVGVYFGFYIVAFIISACDSLASRSKAKSAALKEENERLQEDGGLAQHQVTANSYGAIASDESANSSPNNKSYGTSTNSVMTSETEEDEDEEDGTSSMSSIDEADLDMLDDADDDKNVVRTKTFLYVSDLSRKNRRILTKKYKLYHWYLLTVAVFYALPVVQLVITYQTVFHVTGDQDTCYYNFFCSRPLGVLSSFNNVFSNIGFLMLGILFLLLVYRRDLSHERELRAKKYRGDTCGIPKHYGLFYAMGLALITEGILSACYHVCPSYSNFQFDTSFMYMIAGLCMLKLYQNRHPDINANAYAAYAWFAFVIFTAVLGVVYGGLPFWIFFSIVHVNTILAFSAQIYYMGRWKLNMGIIKRIWVALRHECLTLSKPMYPDRMVVLILGNAINWSFTIYGLLERPNNFASYLLAILIANLMFYAAYYIAMKMRHGEKIRCVAGLHILISSILWGFSFYFFSQTTASWELTPALSREKNEECILLDFYDEHDVWHFLSSAAMFFSFMILLTLDDDIADKPRNTIAVF